MKIMTGRRCSEQEHYRSLESQYYIFSKKKASHQQQKGEKD